MFKNSIKCLGFNDFWFVTIGIMILGVLIPRVFFNSNIFTGDTPFYTKWIESCIYASMYWVINRSAIIYYRKRLPLFEQSQKRILLVIMTGLTGCGLAAVLISPNISRFFNLLEIGLEHPSSFSQGMSATIVTSLFFISVYESIWYYTQLKNSIQEQERVKSAHVQSLNGYYNLGTLSEQV